MLQQKACEKLQRFNSIFFNNYSCGEMKIAMTSASCRYAQVCAALLPNKAFTVRFLNEVTALAGDCKVKALEVDLRL